MPLLNCQARFVRPINLGTKVHTIRLGKRLFKAGQTLYMQTGDRYHPKRFCSKPVLLVRTVTITDCSVAIRNDNGSIICPDIQEFARADGFETWTDLCAFFQAAYDRVAKTGTTGFTITGQLVQWAVAPWESIVAENRNASGCRFTKRCTTKGTCYWDRCRFFKWRRS